MPHGLAEAPGFDAWLSAFRVQAQRQGVSARTLDRALKGLSPILRVIELDRRQPEFTQTFWRYFESAVSEKRVATGRAKLREHSALLSRLELERGIPGRFLVAFWGLETNYGSNLGDFPTIAALATLAHDGRRSAFFRSELLDALAIADDGHAAPDRMIGSWAGAMGQTQFMPSTFRKHAIDQDGDGRIDVWRSVEDALGSGARYLQALGWDGDRTWGREVRLPQGFDVTLASIDTNASETVMSLDEWRGLGIRRADGSSLPNMSISAALVLPSGARGPAFLVYENYRVILKWNRATFYALAVGHLADRLLGAGSLMAPKISSESMSRTQVTTLQERLANLGLIESTGVDGVLGARTRQAIRSLQRMRGLPPDGYVDSTTLPKLLEAASR